ncbi:MAG: methyltransferase family protein, partial [Planctomycetota bacterium]
MSADPTLVFDAASAFWRSATMFAACDIGLFDGLANDAAGAPGLAEQLGASER